MSRSSEENTGCLFLMYFGFFCLANWAIWTHYQTITGPVSLATVVSKDVQRRKNGYDHYLNIQFVQGGLRVATSRIQVEEGFYPEFAPGDTFPITYAKGDPEETAFVGEQFYARWVAVLYGVLLLILAFSGRSLYQKYWRPKKRSLARKSAVERVSGSAPPARFSATRSLVWAGMGTLVFSGGIVSCRHAAQFIAAPNQAVAYEFEQATLLSVQHSSADKYISAVVRLPDSSAAGAPVRVSLSPQQYALLHARLSRLQPQNRSVLVAYSATGPSHIMLADTELPTLTAAEAGESPLGISYSTLGILLSVIGVGLVGGNLIKYARHTSS